MGCKSLMDKTKPKPKYRKGLWSPEEDQRLRDYILRHGHGCWSIVPINAGLQRNGKSCRLRWINYLRPGLKRGTFSAQEEETILNLHRALGNKWSQIAQHLPGRTDNEIKNFWHSYLKKKVDKTEKTDHESTSKTQITNNSSPYLEDHIESPFKSIASVSSFDSFGKAEVLSTNSDQPTVISNQSCLPKLLFTEWLTLDNMIINISNDQNNKVEADQLFPYYNNNSKEIDVTNYNLDFQEGFSQGVIYNEGSSSTDHELCNGVRYETFESQVKFEDHTTENGFGDFFSQDEIANDLFMTNNLMYI